MRWKKRTARHSSPRSQARQHHAHGRRRKLLDFGLAKPAGAAFGAQALTNSGPLTPSIHHESFRAGRNCRDPNPAGNHRRHVPIHGARTLQGKEADARSDIFSFGCVLYEMLTGRHPSQQEPALRCIRNFRTRAGMISKCNRWPRRRWITWSPSVLQKTPKRAGRMPRRRPRATLDRQRRFRRKRSTGRKDAGTFAREGALGYGGSGFTGRVMCSA